MSPDLQAELNRRRLKLIQRQRLNARLSRNWLQIVLGILALYVGLPILAPTLMMVGATGPASMIYTIYSPLCHQFAFRSAFLYGEHWVYPRAAVYEEPVENTFDAYAAQSDEFIALYSEVRRNQLIDAGLGEEAQNYQFNSAELAEWSTALQITARRFRGDPEMGYKMALCARDIAIYGAMLVGGIGFFFVRKRLRPAPLVLYAILGLAPIGLDGFSQLLSYPPFEFWPVRETLPEFRVITGLLFGLMNVWLAFPYMERSFIEGAQEAETTIAQLEAELETA
ncbi:MAG: DUF2085 domain-containing protein [Anaerolineae bacterium]|nr:DUF2085 domain-containing protein [Anaerolineae bacterium]